MSGWADQRRGGAAWRSRTPSSFPVYGNAFIEHKDVHGLTVRASVANVFGGESCLRRTSFTGRRTGPVAFYERRDRTVGSMFSFEFRGSF